MSLVLVSFLFLIGAAGVLFFKPWGRKILTLAALLTPLCLLLRLVVPAKHFYFYHTHLALMVLMSIGSLFLYTRPKIKALFGPARKSGDT